MLKIFTTIATAIEATLTARTPFAPPQKRVHHRARSFENICTPVRCTRKRDFRFFPEDEIPATIRYEPMPTSVTIHVETSPIIFSPVSTTSPASINPTPTASPCPSPRTPFFQRQQRKRVHPTMRVHSLEKICTLCPRTPFFHRQQRVPSINIEAARVHSSEKICTPVRSSRKGGNRFSGEVEIVAAVSKLPSK
eukprot:CAMPEP_0116074168 /NCGR_PEP_ID=MMETSP0322-20121206/15765_1 /TAXON_ID=163516 /ORGANISM="Leptocylindrus danicus var. apora, Strain B651" /LENGTH=193 /DNA_ID=CAMNT_0003563757 /DNA_START=111 /DNA_END=689 /DNA_ORIENTATION=-